MITVHHLNNSRSQRVLWLLEELEIPYEIIRYERDPKTMLAPRTLRMVHPLGKSPVITDRSRTIAESGNIIDYILDEYGEGRLRPAPGTDEHRAYRYWLHYAEGSAMPPLLLKLVFTQIVVQGPWIARPLLKNISQMVGKKFLDRELNTHLGFWEQTLTEHPYFVGDTFSAADIQMSFPLEGAASRIATRQAQPKCFRFLDEVRARPAYQRALERGGPFSLG